MSALSVEYYAWKVPDAVQNNFETHSFISRTDICLIDHHNTVFTNHSIRRAGYLLSINLHCCALQPSPPTKTGAIHACEYAHSRTQHSTIEAEERTVKMPERTYIRFTNYI